MKENISGIMKTHESIEKRKQRKWLKSEIESERRKKMANEMKIAWYQRA
jgi:2-oxoglutarate dehydrogenase complex dehydrogenase (E1) component-like enzyme